MSRFHPEEAPMDVVWAPAGAKVAAIVDVRPAVPHPF